MFTMAEHFWLSRFGFGNLPPQRTTTHDYGCIPRFLLILEVELLYLKTNITKVMRAFCFLHTKVTYISVGIAKSINK